MNRNQLITRDELPSFLNNIKRLSGGSVSINGLIVKPSGLIIGIPSVVQNLYKLADKVGNVGTGVDTLQQFSLPANSLANDGDYVEADYGGFVAANNDDKRILGVFDTTTYEDGLAAPIDLDGGSNNGWRFITRFTRLDSTHITIESLFAYGFVHIDSTAAVAVPGTAGYLQLNRNLENVAVVNLNNNAITMKVQAESATATNNNIVQNRSVVRLCQMS